MATITKRGKNWSVQIRRSGNPNQFKTFPTRRLAIAWATKVEASMDQGECDLADKRLQQITVGELLNRYMSVVTPQKRSACSERLRLTKLARSIGSKSLATFSSKDVAQLRDVRMTQVKPGTVRRELSLLHHAIEIARKEWGLPLKGNPVKDVALPRLANARTRRLSRDEASTLLRCCASSRNRLLHPIVLFAVATALRRSELLNILWTDVDFDTRLILIPQTKTGRPRTIPLTDQAISILRGLAPRGGERPFPLTANALKLAWKRALKKAEIFDFRFHDLRHEGISQLFELGLSVPEVAIVSGHRDPRMLMRYTHLRPIELAEKLKTIGSRASPFSPAG